MNARPGRKVVLLGMMSRMPVAGNAWLIVHYMVGLKRLGYEPYYVEAHARTPTMLMRSEHDDASAKAAAFISGVMERFGFGDRWAFQALHDDGRCYGLSESELMRLYSSATLIVNLHGGTLPRPEHYRTGCLVYLNTDPVEVEVELEQGVQHTIDFLEPHVAFFTWGENYGNPDCRVPVSDRFHFRPTRAPVVTELWEGRGGSAGAAPFTTIGNWRQVWRTLEFRGETYHWSKHLEFLKFLDLPGRTGQSFELALGSYAEEDRRMLEARGWRVRPAAEISAELDPYRDYIARSRGEFTVAKDQNVRLRSGWFSERSSQYLAAGRPVITQDTGFGNALPTGEGLFAFSTMAEIERAVEEIASDYPRHCRAAGEIAREFFDSGVVLGKMLEEMGLPRSARAVARERRGDALPPHLDLSVVSRRPIRLRDALVAEVLALPLAAPRPDRSSEPRATVVVVSYDNLVLTKLCIESVLRNTDAPAYELIVVDNASRDGSVDYLRRVAERHPHVRLLLNESNVGFARANNQALATARGAVLVLLNNDTVVPPGWLAGLARHLEDPAVGLVGAVTNRIGNEAEIEVSYRTYGEMAAFAARRAERCRGRLTDIRTLTMFCLALRRELYETIGPLDERYEVGMLEDDDYSLRVSRAGLRVGCAEDVFVHHFGEASFGALVPGGEYGRILRENQRRFQEKWGTPWQPYGRRPSREYGALVARVKAVLRSSLPADSVVAVVSRGDEELVRVDGFTAWHFPRAEDGAYAGHYPADSAAAIAHLEALRASGAQYLVFPQTAFWWLDHYREFQRHLAESYSTVAETDDSCVLFALRGWTSPSVAGTNEVA